MFLTAKGGVQISEMILFLAKLSKRAIFGTSSLDEAAYIAWT